MTLQHATRIIKMGGAVTRELNWTSAFGAPRGGGGNIFKRRGRRVGREKRGKIKNSSGDKK